MKRILALLLLSGLLSGCAHAQWDTTNTFKVVQFDGTTVADKVTNAQAACNADTAINCILIFDPVLSKFGTGTLPAKCAQCTWVDARTPASLFGNATGNQFLIPDGTITLPGLGFAASPGYGIYRSGGAILFTFAGANHAGFGPTFNGQLNVVSGGAFSFSSSAASSTVAGDTLLRRDAANTLALRNGQTDQTFRVYDCFVTAADSSYLDISSAVAASTITVADGGALSTCTNSGILLVSAATITLRSAGSDKFQITSTGAKFGSGDNIIDHRTGTASLNFTALAANSCEVLTVTVTAAVDGDTVTLGIPNALADVDGATERTTFFGWVSGAGVVSVRRCNVTAVVTADPAAATVRADIWRHN